MKYICTLCNYVVEDSSRPMANLPEPQVPFESLPADWHCPECAAVKEFFQPCSCASLHLYEATKIAVDAA